MGQFIEPIHQSPWCPNHFCVLSWHCPDQCFTNLRFLELKFKRAGQEMNAKIRYKIHFNHKLAQLYS